MARPGLPSFSLALSSLSLSSESGETIENKSDRWELLNGENHVLEHEDCQQQQGHENGLQ